MISLFELKMPLLASPEKFFVSNRKFSVHVFFNLHGPITTLSDHVTLVNKQVCLLPHLESITVSCLCLPVWEIFRIISSPLSALTQWNASHILLDTFIMDLPWFHLLSPWRLPSFLSCSPSITFIAPSPIHNRVSIQTIQVHWFNVNYSFHLQFQQEPVVYVTSELMVPLWFGHSLPVS